MAVVVRRRVLVIEDDEDVRNVCDIALRRVARWSVELAAGGREGLQKARQVRPDVILLDVVMPDIDGRFVLSVLKASPATANIPVVLMSAMIGPEERARCLEIGAAAVIEKPIDPMRLGGHLARVMADDGAAR